MNSYLFPLLIGLACLTASAFTAALARRFGPRRGRWVGVLLRAGLGLPLWVVGLGLAIRAPADPLLPNNLAALDLAGLLLLTGLALMVLAYGALGWRAPAPAVDDTLVAHGLYAHLRHPMYAALALELISLCVLQPTAPVALAAGLSWGWSLLQARLEEIDLLQRLPAYADYRRRVPGFVPRLGAAGHPGPRPTGLAR